MTVSMTKRIGANGLPVVDLEGPGDLRASVTYQRHVLGLESNQVQVAPGDPPYFASVERLYGREYVLGVLARADLVAAGVVL